MSYQAKSTAAMLAIYVLVYGLYFSKMATAASAGPVDGIAYGTLLACMVGLLVALTVVANIVIAALAPKNADGALADERDRLIELRGAYKGSFMVATSAVGAMFLAIAEVDTFWIAHLLLLGLVLGEILKAAAMLVDYRRGL